MMSGARRIGVARVGWEQVVEALFPDGTVIVGVDVNVKRGEVDFIVWHRSFDLVLERNEPPLVSPYEVERAGPVVVERSWDA